MHRYTHQLICIWMKNVITQENAYPALVRTTSGPKAQFANHLPAVLHDLLYVEPRSVSKLEVSDALVDCA